MKTALKSFSNSLTAGKQYPVVRETNGNTIIIDDEGFEVGYSDSYFEATNESTNPQLEGFFIPDDWPRIEWDDAIEKISKAYQFGLNDSESKRLIKALYPKKL